MFDVLQTNWKTGGLWNSEADAPSMNRPSCMCVLGGDDMIMLI